MLYTFYLSNSANFKLFIDRDPDQSEQDKYIFNDNRVIPVYIYLNDFKKAYLIRTCPGNSAIFNLDNPVQILLSASGRNFNELIKVTKAFRENKIVLDNMPAKFFSLFSLALTARGFKKDKALRLYAEYKPAITK